MRGFKETTLSLLLLQLLLILRVTAQRSEVVKPECQSKCGNVTIPFPFGIGEDCYLDKEFAVDCQGNDKPVLNSIDGVEILEISVKNQTMLVNHPVFGTCETNKSMVNETVNLEGTPFFFSSDENMFTGLGCGNDVFTWFEDSENPGGTFLSGCYSVCVARETYTTKRDGHKSCTGISCCQTAILSSFQVFNITTRRNNDSMYNGLRQSTGLYTCRYAFIVEQNWFNDHRDEVPNKTHVPVVLDWGINESSSIVSVINGNYPNANCQHSYFYNNTAVCTCNMGYEGNPYLQYGCADIDECSITPSICPFPMKCENSVGNHTCYYPIESKSKDKMIKLGLGTSLAVMFLLLVAWWSLSILTRRRKQLKRKKEFFIRNGGLLLKQQFTPFHERVDRCKLFRSEDLDKATDQFNANRVLGQGGQGTVYKGILPDERIIAVKKLKTIDERKLDEFVNEIVILSQINHRNVVKLLGCCLETEVPLLVYEFIPNGTLFEYLHYHRQEFKFTWDMRLRIGIEVADALSYLHTEASEPIYHRDIKSANILLDDKLRAKVADFGTSRSVAIDQTHVTTKVQGTFGYLDPEYFHSSQFTDKSDVYSFGVVLVELLTGQRPTSLTRSEENRSLISYFNCAMKENRLYDILDDEVRLGKKEEIMAVASLAKRCLETNGKNRPTMKVVALELERIRVQLEGSIQHHFEEIEHVRTETSGIFSSSTSSTFSILGASTDGEPLMTG